VIAATPSKSYDHCLVIPARNEDWVSLIQCWKHIQQGLLVILVINRSDENDLETLELLTAATACPYRHKNNLCLSETSSKIDTLVVDRASTGLLFSPAEGVGLARKIGADIALTLIGKGIVADRFIHNTDADAVLPANYFDQTFPDDVAAVVWPYRHTNRSKNQPPAQKEAQNLATLLYEISMLYYVNRLAHAQSPYAFHTIGSTISVNATNYVLVRGVPRRLAGEDFYLLNKLAKTGPVITAMSQAIDLDARISHRTPFGTGSSIDRIMKMDQPLDEYLFYQPVIFDQLKLLLTNLPLTWHESAPDRVFSPMPLILEWGNQSGLFDDIVKQKKQINTETVFAKFLHDWMDGFRTLKFVHYLRDHHFESKPLSWVCQQNIDLGTPSVSGIADLETIHQKLTP